MQPSRTFQVTVVAGFLVAGSAVLASCGHSDQQASPGAAAQSFPAESDQLLIKNEFGAVDVEYADSDVITVEREVKAMGRTPSTPNWDLTDSTLTLESACGEGFVGLCEPTYTVTVPTGTEVHTASPNDT